VISQKTFAQIFHSNKHKGVERKHFVEKLLPFEKVQKLFWRPFVSKSILYIFQNPKCNERKIAFKIYQNFAQTKKMNVFYGP
jgi:hypothetical protein